MEAKKSVVAINLDQLERTYFWLDEPVPYKLKDGNTILIRPITLKQSELFKPCADILDIDKNALPDAKIISMSYLQFLIEYVLNIDGQKNEINILKFVTVLNLCLGWERPAYKYDEKGKPLLFDEGSMATITHKEFDDIRRIIMYQNFANFSDEYVNPEVKAAIAEFEATKNSGVEVPSLERKIAIIASHSGIPKQEQLQMTMRSHDLLFEEVCGEVEFVSSRTVALLGQALSKSKVELDHWIFKKKKGKYDGYFVAEDKFNKSMGGDGYVRSTTESGDMQNIFEMLNKQGG